MARARAFVPGFRYPSISITGGHCWLMCDFCKARYLRGMRKASTPEELYRLVRHLVRGGVRGVLISGGFDEGGRLPVGPYLPVIREIKREFGILVSVHAGLVDKALALGLREAGVDIVDYELVLDDYVIRELMHLRGRSSDDFVRSYEALLNHGPPHIVPHILVGANRGRVVKELDAIDVVASFKPEVAVFLVLMPTEGTPLAGVEPPSDEDVIRVLDYARRKLGGELSLGCMRPLQKKYSLDPKVLELGLVDRVVNPLRSLITGYGLSVVEACCSIPRELLEPNT